MIGNTINPTAQNKGRDLQELSAKIVSVPELAGPLLELLEVAGNDPDKLRALASSAKGSNEVSIEEQKRALIEKYNIKNLGRNKVAFTIAENRDRGKLLRRVQALTERLYGRKTVRVDQLEEWLKRKEFSRPFKKTQEIAVDGNVKSSDGLTRLEQEVYGWNNVELCDLVCAHAAYFLLTGRDLFDGKIVRARGGALVFNENGLRIQSIDDRERSPSIMACRAIAPR